MKKLMRLVLGASCMVLGAVAAFAEPSVEITKVKLADARDGTVEYAYTVSGDFEGKNWDLIVKVSADDGTKSTVLTNVNVMAGSVTKTVNVKALFGKAYPGVSFFAKLEEDQLGGVQLWENGPIFAECNLGATRPEEYGYYFWWGDTVGYVHDGSKWVSADGKGATIAFNDSAPANSTYNKDDATLKAEGWIGEDGNLVPTKDAATAHFGSPWRMPTTGELRVLADKCETAWVDNWNGTGINGCLVKGKDAYASKSIFLPAGGQAEGSSRSFAGTSGYCWSTTAMTDKSAYVLYFVGGSAEVTSGIYKLYGMPVRPVR